MAVRLGTRRSGLALPGDVRATLRARCERAVRRARRSGEDVLAGVSLRLAADVDPSAVAFASRRPGEPWFCLEQPDRDAAALATVGAVTRLRATGPRRFAELAGAWRRLAGAAQADAPDGPPGAGLVAVGGFAFAPEGGAAPHWAGFPPGELTVPQLAFPSGWLPMQTTATSRLLAISIAASPISPTQPTAMPSPATRSMPSRGGML